MLRFGAALAVLPAAAAAGPARVCATTPDLGSLVREVGGDDVDLTTFARGPEDPHFMEARPSFLKALSEADLFVLNGLELELGWAPPLLRNARNGRILPGRPGYVDASEAIDPLDVPAGPVDRSMGDVHPTGNPHYLADPVNGLRVARRIAGRLAGLRPERKAAIDARLADFRRRLGAALAGEELAVKYDIEKLAVLQENGRLQAFLRDQKEEALLGGWWGAARGLAGAEAVADHNLWSYFARRFGFRVVGFMEPKPGVPPTAKHLADLVERMKAGNIRLVVSAPYFSPGHARFLSEHTGARVAVLAHQTGAREGADDYLRMVDYNVRQVVEAVR
jgi:ABC-type Zn uptake system ZnuABC Zn-binding protein ZnuA